MCNIIGVIDLTADDENDNMVGVPLPIGFIIDLISSSDDEDESVESADEWSVDGDVDDIVMAPGDPMVDVMDNPPIIIVAHDGNQLEVDIVADEEEPAMEMIVNAVEVDHIDPAVVVLGPPDMFVSDVVSGQPFDFGRGNRILLDMLGEFPMEQFTPQFWTYMVFEEHVLGNATLRNHAECHGSWRLDGPPLIIDGINHRFEEEQLPFWVRDMDYPHGLATTELNLDLFYRCMDFCWSTMLDPNLLVQLHDCVRANGDGGGLTAVAQRDSTYFEVRQCMTSFMEEISEDAFEYLKERGYDAVTYRVCVPDADTIANGFPTPCLRYGSLIHMHRLVARDHCAILFGMGKFAEHRCHADNRMSDTVGPFLAMDSLRDPPIPGLVGFLRDNLHGSRSLRYVQLIDPATDAFYRTHWIANERVLWDYSGGTDDEPLGFVCDCSYCLPI